MKPSEVADKIVFRQESDGYGTTIHAELRLRVTRRVTKDDVGCYPEVIAHLKERMKETILRTIYEDQRADMHKAIYELYLCSPMDCQGFLKACDKIAVLAKYQPPL